MKKNGFTLIELLAVIVILSVIALIATPAVLNIIEDARNSAVKESARNIARAAETYYMQGVMQGETPSSIDLTTDTLNYNGEKPEKGTLTFDATGRAYIKMYMNGYCVVVDVDNSVKADKKDKNECKINAVILSIDAKGGEVSEASREYDSGDEIGTLPTPVKEGYTFKEWTLVDGSSVTSATKITESMTVNASWEANTYTITLVDGDDSTTDQTMQVTYDSAYGNMTEPTKSGYIFFVGWKLEDGTDITSESLVKTSSNHNVYAQWSNAAPNGTAFLFDPTTGAKCEISIGSTTGTNDGCMKWYAFLDSESSSTVNLILDHNTTAYVVWANSGETTPTVVNAKLQEDITNWNDAVKSTARLISASEVNQIAPTNPNWNVNDWQTYYYLHTGTTTSYKGAAGSNIYAWLFDNTNGCTTYGCNVAASGTSGYWTSSFAASGYAWYVLCDGSFDYLDVDSGGINGVRPVITVNKSVFVNN